MVKEGNLFHIDLSEKFQAIHISVYSLTTILRSLQPLDFTTILHPPGNNSPEDHFWFFVDQGQHGQEAMRFGVTLYQILNWINLEEPTLGPFYLNKLYFKETWMGM